MRRRLSIIGQWQYKPPTTEDTRLDLFFALLAEQREAWATLNTRKAETCRILLSIFYQPTNV